MLGRPMNSVKSERGGPFCVSVVPAKAGTQFLGWIPAFAGMTFPGPLPKNSYDLQPMPLARHGLKPSRWQSSGLPSRSLRSGVLFCLFSAAICLFLAPGNSIALEQGYKQYKDPRQRFTFDYPATMKVVAKNPDEVKISHPKATLRIRVFVEEKPKKRVPTAAALLETIKKNLKKELKSASILEEGTLPGLKGAQGYVICFFRDRRNMELVQLLQYYVTEDRHLQMIISDRPEGFKNLQKVIRHIHQSLRINKPNLK
jgi:hypothetical protein